MTLQQLPQHGGEWLRGLGPHGDIVISSRVRLARNLAGYPFVNRATQRQRHEVLERCRSLLTAQRLKAPLWWLELAGMPELDRQLLVERHLISRQHAGGGAEAPRAVAVAADETFAIMVNEEDHLRIQVLRCGMQVDEAYRAVDVLDDSVEEQLDLAYSTQWGYLTACPTNLGTALRVSVMLHLPALRLTGEIDKVRRAARDMQLAVRGLFGEFSEALGDLYQISNQTTLGRSEAEILADFQTTVVPQIISYEQQARQALLRQRQAQLDDRIWRAWGILTHARVLGSDEVLGLLSQLRMGVNLGRIDTVTIHTLNELFLLTQPAHLQKLAGRTMSQQERREERASLVRRRLAATN